MIPRKIHYCWFGGKPKSDLVLRCIDSWKKVCPDYEIIEWNETNWDVTCNSYTREAYQAGKWAFVSDVARLDVIYRYGGLYLDTDVELKSSPQKYMQKNGWLAFESLIAIATGLGFAAEAGNPLIEAMLKDYEGRSFYKKDGTMDLTACPYYNTKVLRNLLPALKMNDTTQEIDGMTIVSSHDYQQFAHHHGAMSWTDAPKDSMVSHHYRDTRLKRFLRTPGKIEFIEAHFPERIFKMYIWFSYDFLEQGPVWMIKKATGKIFK